MRAPFGLGIPRGYPFVVHFKLSNICKAFFAYLYLQQKPITNAQQSLTIKYLQIMFSFFKSRKIEKQALNIYREMWEKSLAVNITIEDRYNNTVRLNCGRFQLHVKDNDLAGKCRWQAIKETNARTCKVFAIALACSNNSEYYSKYAYLVNTINLDGINENLF